MTEKHSSGLDFEIIAYDLLRQQELLEKMPSEMNSILIKAVKKGAGRVRSVEASKITKFSGSTARDIRSRTYIHGIGSVTAKIGPKERNDVFMVLERGRGKGKKAPWIWDLEEWAQKKGLLRINQNAKDSKQATAAALYGLARSISKKGTKARPVRPSVISATHGQVMSYIQDAVNKIIEKLVVK